VILVSFVFCFAAFAACLLFCLIFSHPQLSFSSLLAAASADAAACVLALLLFL
jgi:hypothetical protein